MLSSARRFLIAAASMMGLATLPPMPQPGVVPLPLLVGTRGRSRIPHSNRDHRRHHGIPHGYAGAKLARKAAAGRLGLKG